MKQRNPILFDLADLSIDAAEGKLPKFSTVAYTGGKLAVARYNWPVVIDLAGLDTSGQTVVANLDHNPELRVGHVETSVNDGRTLVLSGVVSATSDAAAEFVSSAKNKFPWRASVEAVPTTELTKIEAGQRVTVNGQTFEGPCLVARKSRLRAVAFLSRPADESTSVTLAAGAADHKGEREMPSKFDEWIAGKGADPATISAGLREVLQKQFDAENVQPENKKPESASTFDLDDIKAAATQCLVAIEAKAAEFEGGKVPAKEFLEIKAAAMDDLRKLKAKALTEHWETPRFELAAKDATIKAELAWVRAERPKGPAIHAGGNAGGADLMPTIEAALWQSLKIPEPEKKFGEKIAEVAHRQFHGRIGLQQMLIIAAAANGYPVQPGERLTDGNLRRVLRAACPQEAIEAAFSTVSLPGVFSNVANKSLLLGYLESDQNWRRISTVKSTSDFKTVTAYRLLDNMEYAPLQQDGTIKHGTLGEGSYTRSVDTYARMFSLTRKDIINDDLGAFDDLRTLLGRGAAKKFNNIFWAAFINNSLFPTDNSNTNYISGSTTTLLTDGVGLGLAVTAFRQMTSPSEDGTKRVGQSMTPRILLVPPALEAAADLLYRSTNIGTVKAADANRFAGKYEPVVVNQMSEAGFTGHSSTAWYLLADPTEMAPMVVSFLNGVEVPTVESAEADFNTLGIQFRGYHDFGVNEAEYLCGIKSKGAA